jgi:HEPN domain-containing protein
MTQAQAVKYWLKSAEQNIKTANDTFKVKHYDWCLFLWHLAIEKTLKGLLADKNKKVDPIHDLLKLAKAAEIPLEQEKIDWLNEITTYNIETRYDDYKFKFYKKANKQYTTLWAGRCRKIYLWLIKLY